MNIDLEQRLEKAREEKEMAEMLQRKLQALEGQLLESKAELEELEIILQKEKRDVERLEQLSLTNLFVSILGTKEERMDKEKQEYLAAKLKFETDISAVKELEKERQILQQQLAPLGSAEQTYKRILKEKEELLQKQGGQAAQTFLDLADKEGELSVLGKELQEALEAARNAHSALEELLESLSSASNWGAWDMLGGGLISTAIKHSKIDNARDQAARAQNSLNRLSRELADVQIQSELSIDIGGLATFADYFFDGLIVDWVIQSRINEAKGRAEALLNRVKSIATSLATELSKTAQKVEKLKEQRQTLVDQYNLTK